MTTNRLSIAVPPNHLLWPSWTGNGRFWNELLPRLGQLVDLSIQEPGQTTGRATDVWLLVGHTDWYYGWFRKKVGPWPLDVRPQAIVVHEAEPAPDPRHRRLNDLPLRRAVKAARLVITPSDHSRARVIKRFGVAPSKVRKILLGVDPAVFSPTGPRLDRASFGLPENLPYIVCVSNAHVRKNLPAIREAIAILAQRGLPHALVLVSSFTYDQKRSMATEQTAFLGSLGIPAATVAIGRISDRDLAALLREAAAFCHPSLMEGFGLAVLEALACGTACVVSDRGALPEVVGDAALLCEPASEPLADALERVLRHSGFRALLQHRAAIRARRFTWSETALAYADALAGVVARPLH